MRARDLSLHTSLFLALVLACGGAGVNYPLLEGAEEIAALALIASCLARPEVTPAPLGRAMMALWCLCLIVAAAQLVPLPPEVWAGLPGRELAARIGDLAGQGTMWRPVSLVPERTLQALLALLPPGAMLMATLRLPVAARWRLVATVVGFGLLSVGLGALQRAAGGEGTLFATPHRGDAVGLFVNRNHQATFLLIAMILGGALGARGRQWQRRWLALGYVALLAVGVVATTSRMGTLLLIVAVPLATLLLFGGAQDRRNWLVGVAVAGLAVTVAVQSAAVQHTLGRFATVEGDRAFFRQDTLRAIGRSFPVGTGLGGFEPAHHAAEPLAHVGPFVPNHAHDDLLELVMDAGAPAVLGLVALAAITIATGRRVAGLPRTGDERRLGIAGLGAIAVILLHSLVDYPARMTAIAVLFAMAGALAAPPPVPVGRDRVGVGRRLALAMGCGLVGVLVVVNATATHLAQGGDETAARRLAPWSSAAWSRLAFLAGRHDAAARSARAALAWSPVDAAAVRTLALSDEASGQRLRSEALMRVAGELGWRDRLAQYWLMEHGFENGDVGAGVTRADALLRQQVLVGPLFAMLHQAVRDAATRRALVAHLAMRPAWGEAFLRDVAGLSGDRLAAHERLLAMLARRSPGLARGGIAMTVGRLAALDQLDRAAVLWATVAGDAPLHDGDFAGPDLDGPFGWTLVQPVATRVAIEVPDAPLDGAALHVRSGGVATAMVASQLVAFPPGRSALRFASLTTAAATSPFEWRIACHDAAALSPSVLAGSPVAAGWVRQRLSVDVPPQGCRFQDLQLWSTASAPSDFWIDRVAIEPR